MSERPTPAVASILAPVAPITWRVMSRDISRFVLVADQPVVDRTGATTLPERSRSQASTAPAVPVTVTFPLMNAALPQWALGKMAVGRPKRA